MPHIENPKIIFAQMIDPHRLELYWDQDVVGADRVENFSITISGAAAAAVSDRQAYWSVKPTYEPEKKRTTIYLKSTVAPEDLGMIAVKTSGMIKNELDQAASPQKSMRVSHLQRFYTRFTNCRSRILIQSSDHASREAHRTAARIIDTMLERRLDIAREMVVQGARLSIYGTAEYPYDIPEHRGGADVMERPVEGFGGMDDNPVTSISEKNVLRIREGVHQTRYLNECILVHEFGHAVHLLGINHMADRPLANELEHVYRSSRQKKLWPHTYAGSNIEEYFATLSTIWFNVMAESATGTWDGVRGPINTRAEMKVYDPDAYQFFSKIYPQKNLPHPWESTPVRFPYIAEITGRSDC